MQYLVTKALLDLHDCYCGDLGLLDERCALKKDREAFSSEQIHTLAEYIDKLHLSKVNSLSHEMRMRVETRIRELEECIGPEVITILRERLKVNQFPDATRAKREQS